MAGFIAFGPDALTPAGGYPGNDDDGRTMQRELLRPGNDRRLCCCGELPHVASRLHGSDRSRRLLLRRRYREHPLPFDCQTWVAGVPFYGSQPDAADVPKINAPLLVQYASNDQRINAGMACL